MAPGYHRTNQRLAIASLKSPYYTVRINSYEGFSAAAGYFSFNISRGFSVDSWFFC